jgi:hypothetical protein
MEKIYCNKCEKKLKLFNQFKCRCDKMFCPEHRHFNTHDCNFDWKEHDRKIIRVANPQVVADKLIKI